MSGATMTMSDKSSSADLVACIAIITAIVSGSLNLHLLAEVNRYRDLSEQQSAQIETMERTLLMTK